MKYKYKLYGAILGDLCGQPYERVAKIPKKINIHNPNSHITDDTVMTLASAYSLIHGTDIGITYRSFVKKYPDCGFGGRFKAWAFSTGTQQNDSYGNGCLMRVSPFMWVPNSLNKLMESVLCSHNHPESVAAVLSLCDLYTNFYRLDGITELPEKFKKLEVACYPTIDYVEKVVDNYYSSSTVDVITLAISHGGDTDTNASIIGEIYNYQRKDITKQDAAYIESKLDPFLLGILKEFNENY